MAIAHATLSFKSAVGRFGVAFVRSVCAQAHVPLIEITVDEDALALDGIVDYALLPVRIQVKATTHYTLDKSVGTIEFPIKAAWRDKWRANAGPTYLILVLVHKNVEDWAAPDSSSTRLRAHALWHRIDNIADDATSLTIDRRQRFTSQTVVEWGDDLLAEFGVVELAVTS